MICRPGGRLPAPRCRRRGARRPPHRNSRHRRAPRQRRRRPPISRSAMTAPRWPPAEGSIEPRYQPRSATCSHNLDREVSSFQHDSSFPRCAPAIALFACFLFLLCSIQSAERESRAADISGSTRGEARKQCGSVRRRLTGVALSRGPKFVDHLFLQISRSEIVFLSEQTQGDQVMWRASCPPGRTFVQGRAAPTAQARDRGGARAFSCASPLIRPGECACCIS